MTLGRTLRHQQDVGSLRGLSSGPSGARAQYFLPNDPGSD